MKRRSLNGKIILLFLLLISLAYSCTKCPTVDQLQGTWYEEDYTTSKTKLVFQGNDLMYYFNPPEIDTLSYTLDTKHKTIFLTLYRNPSNLTATGYTIEYHKRKKVLTITGLRPDVGGRKAITNYQQ